MSDIEDDCESISLSVKSLKDDDQKVKIFAFSTPNGQNFAALFYFGLCYLPNEQRRNQSLFNPSIEDGHFFTNTDRMFIPKESFSNLFFMNFTSGLSEKPIQQQTTADQFYFFYDRNPNIIKNLIKLCQNILYPENTQYICLDSCKDPDKYITKCFKDGTITASQKAIFYTNECISSYNIPLFSYSYTKNKDEVIKSKNLTHSLFMTFGIDCGHASLRLLTLNQTFYLSYNNLTEDSSNYGDMHNFYPYFLLYIPIALDHDLKIQYDHRRYNGNRKTVPPTMNGQNDYLKIYLKNYYECKLKKKYSFLKYLLTCLKFPSAYVAGTDLPYQDYAYYLTILFTNEVEMKDRIISNCKKEDFQNECGKLFISYQKFLSFLRYLCQLIDAFLVNNDLLFLETMKALVSNLPFANRFIANNFIILSKHLAENLNCKTEKDKKSFNDSFDRIIKATVKDGNNLRENLNFFLNTNFPERSSISIYQCYRELISAFSKLKSKLNLDFLKPIDLNDNDRSNDFEFFDELKSHIYSTYLSFNEVEF